MDSSFDIIKYVKLLKTRLKALKERRSDTETHLVYHDEEQLRREIESLKSERASLEEKAHSSSLTGDSESLLVRKLLAVGDQICLEISEIRESISKTHPSGDVLVLQSEWERQRLAVLSVRSLLEEQGSSLILRRREDASNQSATTGHSDTYLAPGTLLAQRYKIAQVIGTGGTSAVYGVTDLRTPQVWAVKELWSNNPVFNEEQIRHQLGAEVRLLSGLRHPNLPRIVDSFEENGRHYIVMDFVQGQTLKTILSQAKTFPLELVLDLGCKLASVLDYLHQQDPPIIFRDLKPANIMIGEGGALKLIDFGIARHFSQSATQDTQALGTPGYAPPEQYGKTEGQSDRRADIYALGANLHEMLTGQNPGRTPFRFAPVTGSRPEVSEQLAKLVAKCVELDPESRFQNAGEVFEILREEQSRLGFHRELPPTTVSSDTDDLEAVQKPPVEGGSDPLESDELLDSASTQLDAEQKSTGSPGLLLLMGMTCVFVVFLYWFFQ